MIHLTLLNVSHSDVDENFITKRDATSRMNYYIKAVWFTILLKTNHKIITIFIV